MATGDTSGGVATKGEGGGSGWRQGRGEEGILRIAVRCFYRHRLHRPLAALVRLLCLAPAYDSRSKEHGHSQAPGSG